MQSHAQVLHDAAQSKFGEVIGFDTRESGDYVFLIRRNSSPFPDRQYMTIRGALLPDSGTPAFYWGHYDMEREKAHADFQQRIAA